MLDIPGLDDPRRQEGDKGVTVLGLAVVLAKSPFGRGAGLRIRAVQHQAPQHVLGQKDLPQVQQRLDPL